jgi:hypothetical protein
MLTIWTSRHTLPYLTVASFPLWYAAVPWWKRTAVWLFTPRFLPPPLRRLPPPAPASTIAIALLSTTAPLRLLVKAFTRAWKLAHSQELTTEAKRAKAKVSLFLLIRHGISSVQSSTSLAIAHTYTRTDAFAATCAAPELRLPLGPLSCDLNPVPFDYHPSRASTRAGTKWLMKSRLYKAQ